MRKCVQCNTNNTDNDRICIFCGSVLDYHRRFFLLRFIDKLLLTPEKTDIYKPIVKQTVDNKITLNLFIHRFITFALIVICIFTIFSHFFGAQQNDYIIPRMQITGLRERVSWIASRQINNINRQITTPLNYDRHIVNYIKQYPENKMTQLRVRYWNLPRFDERPVETGQLLAANMAQAKERVTEAGARFTGSFTGGANRASNLASRLRNDIQIFFFERMPADIESAKNRIINLFGG